MRQQLSKELKEKKATKRKKNHTKKVMVKLIKNWIAAHCLNLVSRSQA